MKKSASLILQRLFPKVILSLCICFGASPAFSQYQNVERILSYDSNIKVNPDGVLTVSETIKVASLGQQIKRGIYRDFPTRYQDRFGNNVVVGFHVISVTRNDQPEPYHIKDWANGKRVYIGQSDRYIAPGQHIYQIIYQTTRQLGFFETHDELYWNVTGNGWSFPILNASATVELPSEAVTKIMETNAFTGYQGQRGRDFEVTKDLFGNPKFVLTTPLAANQGLTILVTWPKGYVQAPTAMMKLRYFVDDNIGIIFVVGSFLTMFLYYLFAWYMVGRDPKKGTIIPLYHPPQDLSPAVIRYLWKMGYDNQVFSVALVNLAVKGHIKIEETVPLASLNFLNIGKNYTLKRTDNVKEEAAAEEKKVRNALLGSVGDEFELDNKNYSKIQDAIEDLKHSLNTQLGKVYFLTNQGYFVFGFLLSMGIGFLAFISLTNNQLSGWIAAIVGILTVGINIVFYRILKAPTLQGRRVMDHLEGFRRYLSVTEKERMNFLNPPEKTPELFEKYLPYALALDVEQKWAEQFSDILAKAANGREYAPIWYSGNSWSAHSPHRFCSNLSGAFTSIIAASANPPGSSSGGGGGFSGGGGGGSSGGGGGGGGGGGW